ncbi:MAG: hypothetical protein Q7S34_03620 [bacterium]|nr:hypothetical protein [bacterium]
MNTATALLIIWTFLPSISMSSSAKVLTQTATPVISMEACSKAKVAVEAARPSFGREVAVSAACLPIQ